MVFSDLFSAEENVDERFTRNVDVELVGMFGRERGTVEEILLLFFHPLCLLMQMQLKVVLLKRELI